MSGLFYVRDLPEMDESLKNRTKVVDFNLKGLISL